jgi:hypothetical protein
MRLTTFARDFCTTFPPAPGRPPGLCRGPGPCLHQAS